VAKERLDLLGPEDPLVAVTEDYTQALEIEVSVLKRVIASIYRRYDRQEVAFLHWLEGAEGQSVSEIQKAFRGFFPKGEQ
jgi:hypothetical protein